MTTFHGMIAELAAAGWCVIAMNYLPSVGSGDWRISAEKKLPSGNRAFRDADGSSMHEAVRRLCRDCLSEGWE